MSNFGASTVSDDGTLTVWIDYVPYTVGTEHVGYSKLLESFKKGDVDSFLKHWNTKDAVKNYCESVSEDVTVVGEDVLYKGQKLHSSLSSRVVELMRGGFKFEPMLKFLQNLMKNPSNNSVEQLYNFLSHKHLPITDDGCFLAYKTVSKHSGWDSWTDVNGKLVMSGDLVDKYSKRVRNNVGDVVEMQRNKVDDNPGRHCSHGYHVGALSYAGPGGWYNSASDTVVLVKVNPADAVSVPTDHEFTKLRVCKYEVVALYKEPLTKASYKTEVGHVSTCDVVDEVDDFFDEVDVDELQYGDVVSFWYTNKALQEDERFVFVECADGDKVTGKLLSDDPSFDEHKFGSFLKDSMRNLRFLD